ncbi:hypothetical protein TD95_000659 [Thielaviopsis punctulata]|uniref:Micro-fibrillar-associated protein 1 C-terminal domain-containing protein n=1 Tax=Thielaviopsis punctulata TaxID=72032 RepID=A0A0F4ZIX0_9PEZI|nr:hypothetical protein TD95_000659 [Thielaviopsis punctulata]
MPPPRMTKNPARPARHRAGKPAGSDSSDSDSDSDSGSVTAEKKPAVSKAPPKAASAARISTSLGKTSIEERRRAEEAEKLQRRQVAQDLERMAAAEGFVTDEEDDKKDGSDDDDNDDDSDDDDDDDDSSEEESSSEDEGPKRLMLRPKFIPKSQRLANATKSAASSSAATAAEEEARLVEEAARKKAEADALVEEQIRKDLASKAVVKKHWDDADDDTNEAQADVDDTDGLDPEAERAAFKLRKLRRYKRDREAMIQREKELEEIERRRNLTEDERRAEDEAHLAKQQEEQDAKGQMAYMQKYYHKGAFYQDQAETAGLANRDIMGARFADEIKDRSVLPEYLQRRDMTKLGRKGATKYKDMKSENTGRWGELTERRPGEGNKDTNWRQLGDLRDVDERFRPDDDFRGGKGANAVPLGRSQRPYGEEARERSRSRHRERSRSRDGEIQRSRDRERRRSRDRSRSRERRRDRSREYRRRSRSRERRRDRSGERRKRSTSRDEGRSDKRRRVEV